MKNPTPLLGSERAGVLDALRGFAVLGIFIANMLHFTGYFFLPEARRQQLAWSGGDHFVEFLIAVFVDGKFYSLFSLLFGIGFAVLLTRCEASGRSIGRFFSRRMTMLLLIGIGHASLIWFGDILALYAMVGYALLLFRKRSDRTLLTAAAVLFALPVVQYAVIMGVRGEQPHDPAAIAQRDQFFLQVIDASANGSVSQMLMMNVGGLIFGRYPDLLFTGRIFKVLATFLIGLWIGRNGIYMNPEAWRPLLVRVRFWGFAVGLPGNLLLAALSRGDSYERLAALGLLESSLYAVAVPALALAYAATFALLWVAAPRRLALFEPVGRMALTNYLLQSVIGLLMFKTVGFGMMGRVSVTAGTLLVFIVYSLQVIFSHAWLLRYRFGPAEWLWRSLTYGKRQPMRLAAAAAAPVAPV